MAKSFQKHIEKNEILEATPPKISCCETTTTRKKKDLFGGKTEINRYRGCPGSPMVNLGFILIKRRLWRTFSQNM